MKHLPDRRRRSVLPLMVAVLTVLTACSHLPDNNCREASTALAATADTRLGRPLAPLLREHPGLSAFHPLGNGLDAFVARLAFAEYADRSIDVQYYLFHDDLSGRSLTAYLLEAADRGVRVRVLLDDMDMNGRDAGLASIALHPNIEIRLFNPFPSRSLRYVNFFTHFGTVTRRMHNKAFIVDNQVAIVGGRNIGDEYFEAADGTNFGDMDLLAIGPIVGDVSRSFDLYWNSELAYPVTTLGAEGDPALLASARMTLREEVADLGATSYGQRLRESNLANSLSRGETTLYWSPAELLYDLPEKVLTDPDDRSTHLGPELDELIASAQEDLLAISPYFVPGKRGVEVLAGLAKRGVDVTVVTNSLASNDVPAVHAGYVRYRRELLKAGVQLYEMRPSPPREEDGDRRFGSSQSSLHAKTFAIDGRIVLVGSMNMDPRSDLLNTEIGIVIESRELAAQLQEWRSSALPREAWRVTLEGLEQSPPVGSGSMQWIAGDTGQDVVVPGREPKASLARRLVVGLLRWLPIEKQL
jgi:putative cardiolipin synthase